MADDSGGLLAFPDNRMRKDILARTRRGLSPTPEQAAWLKEQEPIQRANSYRIADMLTPLPAIGEAIADPSIGSITNAGVRTAMTAFRPMAALGALGAGYGAASVKDSGLLDMTANAQSSRSDRSRARAANAEAKASAARAKAEADIMRAKTEAERQAAETRKQEADAELERQRRAKEQDEYNRAVNKAETLRDQELARDRRFSETSVGKVYDKTGGAAAFLAPFGVGAVQRIAQGPGGGAISKYIAPFVEGAAAAYGVNSLPLYYDAYATESSNPVKQAYGVYGRELPSGHPRKEEALRYAGPESAGGMPDANPVRSNAQRELNDGFWKRLGMSAIEGTMAPLGYAAAGIPGRMAGMVGSGVEKTAQLPGRAVGGFRQGMAVADDVAAARAQASALADNQLAAIPMPPPRVQAPAPQMPVQPPPQAPAAGGLLEGITPPRPMLPAQQPQPMPQVTTNLPKTRTRFDPALYEADVIPSAATAGNAARYAPAASPVALGEAMQAPLSVPQTAAAQRALYPKPGTPQRQAIRDSYSEAVQRAGGPLEPLAADRTIRASAAQEGLKLPSVRDRVAQTNYYIDLFRKANGRLPVGKELDQWIYRNTGTLAVPAAAGGGLMAFGGGD